MSLPASTKFDIFDWNLRASTTDDAGDALLSDATNSLRANAFIPFPNVDIVNGYATFFAQGSRRRTTDTVRSFASITDLPAGVPDTFTFEFDIVLDEDFLPMDFSDPEQRIFVGAVNQQGATAGFLFSYDGIALARYPEDPSVTRLSGSKALLFDDSAEGSPLFDSVTVRAIVDGDDNRLSIYVGATSEVYVTGFHHLADITLKYNISAPSTVEQVDHPSSFFPLGDGIALQASARPDPEAPTRDTLFSISSLRMAASAVLPEDKPVATAFTVRNTLVGTPITLFGGRSFDPKAGKALEYNWEIELAPETSTATLQGAQRAFVSIGSEADNNELRIVRRRPTAYVNTDKIVLKKGLPNDTLKVEVGIDDSLVITLGVDAQDSIYTTALDLKEAFDNAQSTGYNQTAVDLFSVDLTNNDSSGLGTLPVGEFSLSGGSGSTLANPLFIPDTPGVYVLSLTVFNGIRVSSKARVAFTADITNQLVEHRPNSNYIFKYLPDFWNLVQDKEQISSIWSALTQVLSADFLTLWQNDYAKTIRDISRRYQRRWQYYETSLDVEVTVPVTVVMPPNIINQINLEVTPNTSGTHSKKATFPGDTAVSAGKCLVRGASSPISVVDVVSVDIEFDEQDVPTTTLVANTFAFPYVTVQTENSNGFFVRDPDKVFSLPEQSDIFSNVVYALKDIALNNVGVRIFRGANKTDPVELIPNSYFPAGVKNSVRVDAAFPVDGARYTWQHIVPVDDVTLEQQPYLSVDSVLPLNSYGFGLGDYVQATVVDPYTASEIVVSLPILAVDEQDIFLDWSSLITALTVAAAVAGDEEAWSLERAFGDTGSTGIDFTLNTIVKAKETFASDDLIDVPRLGTSTLKSSMHQHVDYSVENNKVVIKDWVSGTADTEVGRNVITANLPITFHPQVTHNTSYQKMVELGVNTLIISSGPDAGVYGVTNISVQGNAYSITLDQALTHTTEAVSFRIPRYGAYSTKVDKLWAEVSYFDNTQTIENNFGLFVGLPEHVLRKYDSDKNLDYLSVVRSMWFAFMSGPSFHNLQLALQTFFNVPYTERGGQVIVIEEPTDTKDGYIIVEEDNGRTSTYTFPIRATLALNPRTGRTIKAFPAVELESEVTDAKKNDFQDSKVDPYVKLVDLINFDDYISDPALIDIQLKGQDIVKKYHTFVVDVPLNSVRSTEIFPLVRDFLTEAKPAYTDFVLVGSLQLQDGISVVDDPNLKPRLMLKDTPHTSPFFARTTSVENVLWPQEDVVSRADVGHGAWSVEELDVKERYESSYSEGVLDDFSGDGSVNARHKVMDHVNKLSSDIDVVKSRLWVPCTIDTSDAANFNEFITGEPLELYGDGGVLTNTIWNQSPPVVLHIGSSVHPKVPFGVYSPQFNHPNTYLILGFENEQTPESDHYTNSSYYTDLLGQPTAEWEALNCYGNESRLDVLRDANDASGNMYLQGKQSGAKANLSVFPDRSNAADSKYFLLERVFRADKYSDEGPESTATAVLTTYIPLGGLSVADFKAASPSFDTDDKLKKELQQHPYDSTQADNEQFVPSFSPGVYAHWLTPPTNMRLGYVDVPDLVATPTAITDFLVDPNATDLQNIHLGFRIKNRKGYHLTHGFVEFYIPPPSIYKVTSSTVPPNTFVRIEGYYFVAPDTTQVGVLTSDPASFNGTIGGSWVFFRDTVTGQETPCSVAPVFETGIGTDTVLDIDGAVQSMTGHVLTATVPTLSAGTYDVIVRNYRPYRMTSAQTDSYHMDEAIAGSAFVSGS